MLKCFFVISFVIPCEAEGPDKAFNCVCHAVCRGGQAWAFHPVLREAQLKPLSGPHRWLAAEEPKRRGQTGYATLRDLHITKNTGLLPFSHLRGILLSVPGWFPAERPAERARGLPVLQHGAEACLLLGAWVEPGVRRGAKAMLVRLCLSWLNEVIHRSASQVSVSARSSLPKVKASFVIGFSWTMCLALHSLSKFHRLCFISAQLRGVIILTIN